MKRVVYSSQYLEHHGILGQKWGKRNGPPYPLDSEDHSAREKKVGWRKSLANNYHKKKAQNLRSEADSLRKSGLKEEADALDKKADKHQSKIQEMPDDIVNKTSSKEKQDYRNEMISRYSKSDPEKAKFYKNATDKEIAEDIERKQQIKKALITTAVVAGLGVGVYAAYKYGALKRLSEAEESQHILDKYYHANLKQNPELRKIIAANSQDIQEILDRNSVLHRMEAYKDVDITKIDKIAYTAYDKKDVAKYMALLKDWSGTGQRYDTQYKALKDIVIPTKDAVRKVFDDLWATNDEYKKAVIESLRSCYKYAYTKQGATPGLALDSVIDTMVARDRALMFIDSDKAFETGIYTLVSKGKDSDILRKELMKKGYDAITDYFDAGTFTDKPLIILDPQSSLQKIGEEKVTELMKMKAIQYLYTH